MQLLDIYLYGVTQSECANGINTLIQIVCLAWLVAGTFQLFSVAAQNLRGLFGGAGSARHPTVHSSLPGGGARGAPPPITWHCQINFGFCCRENAQYLTTSHCEQCHVVF